MGTEAVLRKSTACVNTSTDTAYTDTHKSNVPSLGLKQQHKSCDPTPRGAPEFLYWSQATEWANMLSSQAFRHRMVIPLSIALCFIPRRWVPKSHSTCFSSCCWNQFSRVQKSLRLS